MFAFLLAALPLFSFAEIKNPQAVKTVKQIEKIYAGAGTVKKLAAGLKPFLDPDQIRILSENSNGLLKLPMKFSKAGGDYHIQVGRTRATLRIEEISDRGMISAIVNLRLVRWDPSEPIVMSLNKVIAQVEKKSSATEAWMTGWALWALPTALTDALACFDYKTAAAECAGPGGKKRPVALHAGPNDAKVVFDEPRLLFIAEAAAQRKYALSCTPTHEAEFKSCLQKRFEKRPQVIASEAVRTYLGLVLPAGSADAP